MNSIVPQAVNSFLSTFSSLSTAASNGLISDEIGLKLYGDGSTTLAYVAIQYGYYGDGTIADSNKTFRDKFENIFDLCNFPIHVNRQQNYKHYHLHEYTLY